MSGDAQETKDEIHDVVQDLRVSADLLETTRKCSRVAHDAQQMDPFEQHLKKQNCESFSLKNVQFKEKKKQTVMEPRRARVGRGPAEQMRRSMTVTTNVRIPAGFGSVMAIAAERSITAHMSPDKWPPGSGSESSSNG